MSIMEKITSINQLKEEASAEDGVECFIQLMYGLRSSKCINYDGETFYVYNEINDTEDELTEEELFTESNVGEAIEKGALIKYDF